MPLRTSDQQVTAMFSKYLEPGETDLIYAYGMEGPSLLMQALLLGPLISLFLSRYYFVGVTNHRVLLMRISSNYNEKSIETFELNSLSNVSAKKAWMGKTVQFTVPGGTRHHIMMRNKLWGLSHQREYAEQIGERLQQRAM